MGLVGGSGKVGEGVHDLEQLVTGWLASNVILIKTTNNDQNHDCKSFLSLLCCFRILFLRVNRAVSCNVCNVTRSQTAW